MGDCTEVQKLEKVDIEDLLHKKTKGKEAACKLEFVSFQMFY